MKEIYQVEDGYVIPSNGIETRHFNGREIVRFDIQKYEHTKRDGEEQGNDPLLMQCEHIERESYDYPTLVSDIVRCRYSQADIEAIVLNGTDTEEHAAEYQALQEWRNHAKEVAKVVLATM